MKEKRLNLGLKNIYGGDGFERTETMKEVKLKKTNKTITVRKDVGIPVEKEKERTEVREKEVNVKTFKRDDDDTPLYRIGGVHGKFWGLLKEAGYSLYQMGKQENKVTTDRVMKTVRIEPQWVRLEMDDGVEMEMDSLPQELSGRSSSMIQIDFDIVPECSVEITLKYPEEYEDLLEQYLDLAQTMPFGNKRRGSVNILKEEEVN